MADKTDLEPTNFSKKEKTITNLIELQRSRIYSSRLDTKNEFKLKQQKSMNITG